MVLLDSAIDSKPPGRSSLRKATCFQWFLSRRGQDLVQQWGWRSPSYWKKLKSFAGGSHSMSHKVPGSDYRTLCRTCPSHSTIWTNTSQRKQCRQGLQDGQLYPWRVNLNFDGLVFCLERFWGIPEALAGLSHGDDWKREEVTTLVDKAQQG